MKIIKLKLMRNITRTTWLKCNLSIVICFFCSYNLKAQDLDYYVDKYKEYSELQTVYSEVYDIKFNKEKKIDITLETHEELMVLSDKASGFTTVEGVLFSDLLPLLSYEAYTVNLIKGKDKKTEVAKVSDRKYNRQNIFDSDLKIKEFTFANLTQNSRKVVKHKVLFKDPYLLHRFNLTSTTAPSVKRQLILNYPENVKISYKAFNTEMYHFEVVNSSKKGQNTLSISIVDPKILKFDGNNPGILYEMPHIHFWIDNYTIEGKKHEVLGTVEKLYTYYLNFIRKINTQEDPDLKKFTLELIKNDNSTAEKLKSIFNWVQKNIKYIAFESGYEGFVPREASEVFKRKFGDCKDMTSIICEMAKYANIPNVNFTWIGSRELPYTYEELPTLAVDNHMIASYLNGDEVIFLDATDSHVPFGQPSSFIQDKEALIAQGNSFIIKKVPTVTANSNKTIDVIQLTLENSTLVGNGIVSMNGLVGTKYRNMIGDNQRLRTEFIKNLVEKGNDKFKLKEFKEQNFDNDDKPYEVYYNFELDNYMVQSGNDLYLNLALNQPLVDQLLEGSRVMSYDLDMLENFETTLNLTLPENFKLAFVPEQVKFENDLIKYEITYTLNGDKLSLSYQVSNKKLMVTPKDFNTWNQSIKTLKQHLSENIILKKHEKN